MLISGPAHVSNPGSAQAVRNPVYGPGGVVIGSGSRPGVNNLPVMNQGSRYNFLQQLAKMNRMDPRENLSMTEEELRRAALMRLRRMQSE